MVVPQVLAVPVLLAASAVTVARAEKALARRAARQLASACASQGATVVPAASAATVATVAMVVLVVTAVKAAKRAP
jgi:hypothetical protein